MPRGKSIDQIRADGCMPLNGGGGVTRSAGWRCNASVEAWAVAMDPVRQWRWIPTLWAVAMDPDRCLPVPWKAADASYPLSPNLNLNQPEPFRAFPSLA